MQISLKYVHLGPTDNKWILVQVMAWHQTGSKPLPEPLYWCIQVSHSLNELNTKYTCIGDLHHKVIASQYFHPSFIINLLHDEFVLKKK